MKRNGRMNRIKKASFTVEAAVIVPIVALMIAMLLGFIFFMHENSVSAAVSYEAEFYAAQKTVNNDDVEEMLTERLATGKKERSIGFGEYSYSSGIGSSVYTVSVTGEILPAVFKGLFSRKKNYSIDKIDPVSVKRLMWTGGKILGG